jgi:hypothetical protein
MCSISCVCVVKHSVSAGFGLVNLRQEYGLLFFLKKKIQRDEQALLEEARKLWGRLSSARCGTQRPACAVAEMGRPIMLLSILFFLIFLEISKNCQFQKVQIYKNLKLEK